jgi:hypothetical protein
MRKEQIRNSLKKHGESIVNYRSLNSKKLKYVVCTVDFDNDYIQSKVVPVEQKDKVLVFCWDSDNFKQLNISLVTSVEPLNAVLKGAYVGR